MWKLATIASIGANLVASPISASAQSPGVPAQSTLTTKDCVSKLVLFALRTPKMTAVPDAVAIPLGLHPSGSGSQYLTRQASFDDNDGYQHALAVSATIPDKILFIRANAREKHVLLWVISPSADFLRGGMIEKGAFALRNDAEIEAEWKREWQLWVKQAYPKKGCGKQ